MEPLAEAIRFIQSRRVAVIYDRDALSATLQKKTQNGNIIDALGLQFHIARLEGEMDGLAVAITQLQVVQKRMGEK